MSRQQTHGITAYKKRGCRCPICLLARDADNIRRRKFPEQSFKIPAGPLVAMMRAYPERLGGMWEKRMKHWEENGVDIFTADRNCCKRGMHPYEVYGDAWFEFGPEQ